MVAGLVFHGRVTSMIQAVSTIRHIIIMMHFMMVGHARGIEMVRSSRIAA
jgi:hypothetical protein